MIGTLLLALAFGITPGVAVVHDRGQNPTVYIGLGNGPTYFAGDTNLDGRRDGLDIKSFVLALTAPEEYETRWGIAASQIADVNGDGAANALDIAPFVRAASSR